MNNLTLLTEDQIFGRNNLKIFNKIGTKAAITDFSILLGGFVSDSYFTNEGNELKHRTGYYWTKTDDGDNDARVVAYTGSSYYHAVRNRRVGARPALPYSLISGISSNKVRGTGGVLEVEYGEYPQWAPPRDYQLLLETQLKNGIVTKTTDYITTDSRSYNEYNDGFKAQTHQIYEYGGKKYIRVEANPYKYNFKLSNGREYNRGDYVWVEISPIKWVVDEQKDIALSKNIIFAGVQFKKERDYKGDFSKTDINWFMNTYLIKDLLRNNTIVQNTDNTSNLTKEQLLEEIKILRTQLEETIKRNNELTKENTSYKQRIRRIQDITNE